MPRVGGGVQEEPKRRGPATQVTGSTTDLAHTDHCSRAASTRTTAAVVIMPVQHLLPMQCRHSGRLASVQSAAGEGSQLAGMCLEKACR